MTMLDTTERSGRTGSHISSDYLCITGHADLAGRPITTTTTGTTPRPAGTIQPHTYDATPERTANRGARSAKPVEAV